jgi:hypothetical protein
MTGHCFYNKVCFRRRCNSRPFLIDREPLLTYLFTQTS